MALKVLVEENMVENSARMGDYLMSQLRTIKSPNIKEIRGKGLFVGIELHVIKIAPNPNYTFDPDVFPESAEARQIDHKLILPPGPNNPVPSSSKAANSASAAPLPSS